MKAFKIVFVGGGINSIAGYPHFSASKLDGKFELIGGVFSRNEDINLKSAEFYSVKFVAKNLEELINLSKNVADIAVVLTPTPLHFEHVEALLNAGFPVICEKPLFKTYEEILEFEKRVDLRDKFLVITYNYVAYPMVYELRQMVVNGELGEIINVHLEMPQESFLRPPPRLDYPPWWRKEDGPIPTIILDLASHLFSLSYYITGMKIVKVKPALKKYSKYRVVDEVKGIIEYENGSTGFVWVSKVALGNRNGLRVSIYGSKASAVWLQEEPDRLIISESNGQRRIIDRANSKYTKEMKIFNRMIPGHPSGYIEALANLYNAIYDAFVYYQKSKTLPDNPLLWTFEKEKLNFEFMKMLSHDG